ncbi:MAG: DUF4258 domain-containing protein [Pseudomonadota bacterium]
MQGTFRQVLRLIEHGHVNISDHGYDELGADGIFATDVLNTVADAIVVEDYPDYPKGPCVLVLQRDGQGKPVHVLWGIPRDKVSPAVLVTAYRPDPKRWSRDFLRRQR